MIARAALSLVVLSALALATRAAEEKAETHAGLDMFKQLAGEWTGKEVKGEHPGADVHVKYKITAAGSAVVETLFPGKDHEMVTVIHRDGDDLVLTHYCALGNQPQMRAPGKVEGNKVAFKFARATNLTSEKAPHMHDVTFTFIDKDTLKSEWVLFQDGKAKSQVVFELKRKK